MTDARQQLHFQQLFAVFRRWHPEAKVKLAHVWFGSILGEDGKPFKTRSGETIKLADLLDEAEERALKVVSGKSPELPEAQRREIARVVGLGAVKYADLLPNRQSDYVFSWDKMLALNGNTAPYLQYAYARIRSIFRKQESESKVQSPSPQPTVHSPQPGASRWLPGVRRQEPGARKIRLESPQELALARDLLNFGLAWSWWPRITGRISSATISTNWPATLPPSTRTVRCSSPVRNSEPAGWCCASSRLAC